MPTLNTTIAFVRACDGSSGLWIRQHKLLMKGGDQAAAPGERVFVPWRNYFDNATTTRTPSVAALREEMRRLWKASGLTLKEISERTAEFELEWPADRPHGIGVSTISALCNPRRTGLPRRRTLHGFLLAVEAEADAVELWLAARNQMAAKQDSSLPASPHAELDLSLSKANPAASVPSEGVVDSGQQLLARFRRLRVDIGRVELAVSSPRIAAVLESLGVYPKLAEVLSEDRTAASRFVMNLDAQMHAIMKESSLPPNTAPMALELAVYRVQGRVLRGETLTPVVNRPKRRLRHSEPPLRQNLA